MENRVLGNILRIGRCCQLYRKRALGDTDLRPGQHLFIHHICRRPGLAQEALIGELYLDKTTVAHQLMKLEDQGYIRREASAEDGRCRRVYPTEKALEIYPRVRSVFGEFTAGLLEGLTEADKTELERLTALLRANAVRMAEEGEGEK